MLPESSNRPKMYGACHSDKRTKRGVAERTKGQRAKDQLPKSSESSEKQIKLRRPQKKKRTQVPELAIDLE